jgi:demethylmenaquinone methyltransferase/2-methoxy-6-polyprenyl-1,4-benzoquinol methylase
MLAAARQKAAAAGHEDAISLQVGTATSLAFADHSFDGVMSAFVLRNLADRPRAFAELYRVLRPGGRVVHAEATEPTCPVLRLGHRVYVGLLVPLAGRLLVGRGPAYRYLANSIHCFPRRQAILDEMAAAGFVGCRAVPLTKGIVTLFIGHVPGPPWERSD